MKKLAVKLYGIYYDLEEFSKIHPGGIDMIKVAENLPDATPLFESYHKHSINVKILEKYKIPKNKLSEYHIMHQKIHPEYTYDFYNKLKKKVYTELGDQIYKFYRPIDFFILLLQLITSIYLIKKKRKGFSFLAGCLLSGFSVGIMHSSGHYSLVKNKKINEFFYIISGILSFVIPSNSWRITHNYFHHLYTGSSLDPDINNWGISTHELSTPDYTNILIKLLIIFLIFSFPGQLTGMISRTYRWYFNKGVSNICGSKLRPKFDFKQKSILTFSLIFYTYFAKKDPKKFFLYILGMNFSFASIVIPDHTTFKTRTNIPKSKDWGEIQICESANFSEKNFFLTYLFGGINYQIEHHLFPKLPHHLYPKISKIIKQECKENNIKYTSFPNWFTAFSSFCKNCLQ